MTVLQILQQSTLIASFVTVMMIVIEYIDARWGGVLARHLRAGGVKQLLVASALGATPGCLGAFIAVSLFARGRLTAGALVATMIATSGDEAFVMFALFPARALALTLALAVLGFAAGWATDTILRKRAENRAPCCDFTQDHPKECDCLPRAAVLAVWKHPSGVRLAVTAGLLAAMGLIAAGWLGPPTWNWKRITLLFVVGVGMFVVATVPEAFLRNHLVKHVLARHVPRIFAWTAATLGVMALAESHIDISSFVSSNPWGVLGLAAALGVVPESGPHLLFTTLYAQGAVPLSILVASSMVQDGHGMLPLLAHSRAWFLAVKGINLVAGLVVGAVLLAAGW